MRQLSLSEAMDYYNLICRASQNLKSRQQAMALRKQAFTLYLSSTHSIIKVAFDTRRIDQETEYNPRRNLQNFNRSEQFISENLAYKVKSFAKLRDVLNGLKDVYGKEHEWQDSNARILLTAIDNGLRTGINDEDFAVNQPGVGSFDYLEELLHMRYRLNPDQLHALAENDIKKVILSKDEELIRKDVKQSLEITKRDISTKGYDTLLEKLFDGCRATAENPSVKRTVSITIEDHFIKES